MGYVHSLTTGPWITLRRRLLRVTHSRLENSQRVSHSRHRLNNTITPTKSFQRIVPYSNDTRLQYISTSANRLSIPPPESLSRTAFSLYFRQPEVLPMCPD